MAEEKDTGLVVDNSVTDTANAEEQAKTDVEEKVEDKPVEKVGDWTSGLDDNQKQLLAVKGWKTPADVMKSYSEVEKFMGQDKIAMPRKDKNGEYEPGEYERVMKQLGMPKEFTEYKVSDKFELPEGLSLKEPWYDLFRQEAHQRGMTSGHFSFVMDKLAETIKDGTRLQGEATTKESQEADFDLRKKWGGAYEVNKALGNRVLNSYASDKLGREIVKKYGNDPHIIEMLATVGEHLSEEGLARVGASGEMMTADQAAMKIKQILGDPTHPIHQPGHAEKKFWDGKMDQLYKMRDGGR